MTTKIEIFTIKYYILCISNKLDRDSILILIV